MGSKSSFILSSQFHHQLPEKERDFKKKESTDQNKTSPHSQTEREGEGEGEREEGAPLASLLASRFAPRWWLWFPLSAEMYNVQRERESVREEGSRLRWIRRPLLGFYSHDTGGCFRLFMLFRYKSRIFYITANLFFFFKAHH